MVNIFLLINLKIVTAAHLMVQKVQLDFVNSLLPELDGLVT